MNDLDVLVEDLKLAGFINDNFDEKVEKYKKESPLEKVNKENAFLLMNLAEKEMEIENLGKQQGELLMFLAEKGVL